MVDLVDNKLEQEMKGAGRGSIFMMDGHVQVSIT